MAQGVPNGIGSGEAAASPAGSASEVLRDDATGAYSLYDRPVKPGRTHPMSLQDRIEALKARHHALEEALEVENGRPRPDEAEIAKIKKQKLQIKDEIATLSHQH
jgi:hypothetical protein